jgi:hypothetical protein
LASDDANHFEYDVAYRGVFVADLDVESLTPQVAAHGDIRC